MYSYRSFSDIPVVPFSSVLAGPLGGAEHLGGPIWPDWDSRTFERHCRDQKPIDCRPELNQEMTPFALDHAFWGGPIASHFGHQIADFSMRIFPSRFVDQNAKLVFCTNLHEPPKWFHEVLRWAEIEPEDVVFTKQALQFNCLSVCEQSEQLWAVGPSNYHLDRMDEFINNKSLDLEVIYKPIYVSRAGLGSSQAGFAGERYLEHCINEAGGYVFRPETHSIQDQLMVYLRASKLIFAEGSAVHLCQLLGRLNSRIDILIRSQGVNVGNQIVSRRVLSYEYVDLLKNVIHGLTYTGENNLGNSISLFNIQHLFDYFFSQGLNISKHWNMNTYIDEAIKDIYKWVQSNTGNRQFNTKESDLMVISCLRNAGFNSIARYVEDKIKSEFSVSVSIP